MAGLGLTPEDYEGDAFEIWPENWPVFMIFCQIQTQWRTGINGADGLDYSALYPLLDRAFPEPAEWDQAFDEIRLMESEATRAMRSK